MYHSIASSVVKCGVIIFIGVLLVSSTHLDNDLSKVIHEECDIAAQSRCKGIVDCYDNSDEIGCCSKTYFSCGPNHFIDKSKVCNGISDCANNKDETNCQCVLPNVHPKNTEVFLYNDVVEVAPGTVFNMNDLIIEYNCTDGYIEISDSWQMNYCTKSKNGTAEWDYNTFLGCSRTCPKTIFDNHSNDQRHTILCRDENKKIFNCRTEPHIFPGTTVQMRCNADDLLTNEIKCEANGNWSGSFPDCYYTRSEIKKTINQYGATCSTELLSKPSLKLIFTDSFGTVVFDDVIYAGIKVQILCAEEYYSYSDEIIELTCNENGEWMGGDIPMCKMVCGERSGRNMVPSMSNGIKTSTMLYPWVAAIYRKISLNYVYICGGTIITPKLVISAAHCFTTKANYLIGVGKKFRQFVKEDGAQIHEISDMIHLAPYLGNQTYYANDIIAIVVKQFIRFDVHIKPVCIDYEARPIEIKEDLLGLDHGYIAGWGTLENSQLSEELIYTSHPIVDDCRTQLCENGRLNDLNYLTSDKFCAGNFDHSTVCSGDSGHGLVFEKLINNRLRYYLYGVLSLTAENCSAPSYGFYTNVQNFKNEIKDLVAEYED